MEWSIRNIQYSLPLYHSDLVLPLKSALSLTLWDITRFMTRKLVDQLQAPLLSGQSWGCDWGSSFPFSDIHFWFSSSLASTSASLPGKMSQMLIPEDFESLAALPSLAVIAVIHVHCYHQARRHQEKAHESPAFPASFSPTPTSHYSSNCLSSWPVIPPLFACWSISLRGTKWPDRALLQWNPYRDH